MARRFGKRVDQLNGVISGAFRRKARWELGRENIGKFFQKGADDLGEKVKRAEVAAGADCNSEVVSAGIISSGWRWSNSRAAEAVGSSNSDGKVGSLLGSPIVFFLAGYR